MVRTITVCILPIIVHQVNFPFINMYVIITFIIITIRVIINFIYFSQKVRFDATKVRYFIMSRRSLTYFEQHFLFSNRLVALFIGLHPNRSSNNQLLLFCVVTVYLFPIIVHQVNDVFLFLRIIIIYIIIGYFDIIIILIISFKRIHLQKDTLCVELLIKCLYYLFL